MAYLFIKEVSQRTRVPESTLRFWRHKGIGPKSARVGRRVMWLEADVDAWMAAQFAQNEAGGPDA